jgi:hypothetical protein
VAADMTDHKKTGPKPYFHHPSKSISGLSRTMGAKSYLSSNVFPAPLTM